ncbi:hypothetical protein [Shimia thalassica]|uniref:hypothetical protein n=1 Tax=Shimia thalassica TaxID=1715693 RepID=UPI00349FB279
MSKKKAARPAQRQQKKSQASVASLIYAHIHIMLCVILSSFRCFMQVRSFLSAIALASATALPVWAVELVMVEQTGCYTCKQWNEEIAPVYPNTEAGQFAPLRREELRHPPDDLTYARRVNYTPTFILIDEGKEIARLEGYPGEDFFWWHLETLLAEKAGFEGATR